jgi:hypothetical protein
VDASTVRTYGAIACIPAALVVLADLALKWHDAGDYVARRDLAFSHGIALAVVLGAALICSRVALALETREGAPFADAVGILGAVAVLADLARVWRDSSDPLRRFSVTATHILAMAVVAAATMLIARAERRRRAFRRDSGLTPGR